MSVERGGERERESVQEWGSQAVRLHSRYFDGYDFLRLASCCLDFVLTR